MPKYSIVVPLYNSERFLRQCIESVINQTYTNWELILVNDGSTDNSIHICNEYKSQRIHVLDKKNKGVARARKCGAMYASGKYITFLDSDDYLEREFLDKVERITSEYQVDMVVTGKKVENKKGEVADIWPFLSGYLSKDEIKKNIYPYLIQDERANYFAGALGGFVFIADKIRPYMIENPKARIGEDGACLIPAVFYSDSVYILNEALYFYRYNSTSATKGKRVFGWDNPEVNARHIMDCIDVDVYGFRQQIYRRIVHELFNVCVTRFYQEKKYNEISGEICMELRRPFYKYAIKHARFSHSFKAVLMSICMRYVFTLPMFLYSKVKRF